MKLFRIRIKDVNESKELRFRLEASSKWTVDDLFKLLKGAVIVGKKKKE